MSFRYPPSMRHLINELSKLPSIGEKSAARLAYHLLAKDIPLARSLASSLVEAAENTKLCVHCFFLTEADACSLCTDGQRDRHSLCVVEKPADVFALERSGGFRGVYHVLHGVWSPLKGMGPEQTKMGQLMSRLSRASKGEAQQDDPLQERPSEMILATGATVEGDATALYLANVASELEISVTRIAQGIPKGGDLEYADELTLNLSLEGRRKI